MNFGSGDSKIKSYDAKAKEENFNIVTTKNDKYLI